MRYPDYVMRHLSL